MKKKLAVILGPTATGKSHCGIALAQALDGEIISGDSMLVYRGMDIGTAKPTAEELAAVPHHMVDILPPDAGFNVVDFKEEAERLIDEITARGRLPIIVGGTGLYIKALLENYHFNAAGENAELRRELETLLAEQGKEVLFARLQKAAPHEAERIDINNTRRVIRAIEAAESGDNLSHTNDGELAYDAVVFGLRMERSVLYDRINRRVDIMLEQGLLEETKKLLDSGVPASAQSMQAIGYRQTVMYLTGQLDYATAVDKLKQATRNFAKRQFTWYKKMPYVQWFDLPARPDYGQVTAEMISMIKKKWK